MHLIEIESAVFKSLLKRRILRRADLRGIELCPAN